MEHKNQCAYEVTNLLAQLTRSSFPASPNRIEKAKN